MILRSRGRAAAGLALAALGLAASAPAPAPLRALRWLSPAADPVAALTRAPPECYAPAADPEQAWREEVGRAAFRTPLLLGGQAARAGVSCETCHRSGRDNPDFDFPGVSLGHPGSADVTSSLFSSHRGDGIDNPRPIPDLGGPREALKVSRAPEGRALETFIDGLVTQEFDGAEPPPAVLDGLAAYVRALRPEACPPGGDRPVTLAGTFNDAERALVAAEGALRRGDAPSAVLLTGAARSALGRIDERYAVPELSPLRAGLRAADLDLAAIQARIRRSDPAAGEAILLWRTNSGALRTALAAREDRSLFSAARLARALAASPAGASPGTPPGSGPPLRPARPSGAAR